MSYKNLEMWNLSKEDVIEIHKMTLSFPKFEIYEEGIQIRRSSKSVISTIVAGYGGRNYKSDYIKFLTYALASNDETIDHLETLFKTESLTDKILYESLYSRIETLGKKINRFIQAVQNNHLSDKLIN